MSLKPTEIYGFGLFCESDFVSLSPSMSIGRNLLYDHASGAKHQLHPLAAAAIMPLQRGLLFHKWLFIMLDNQMSVGEVSQIIGFLNRTGGFEVQRPMANSIRLSVQRLRALAMGLKLDPLTRRRRPNFGSLIRTVVAASLALVIATFTVSLMSMGSGISGAGSTFVWLATFLPLILSSTVVHEWGHISALSRHNHDCLILQQGSRLGIIHSDLPVSTERLVAIAGPAAGILLCALVFIGGIVLGGTGWLLATIVLVALFNLIGLLPAFGDGRSLGKLFKLRGSLWPASH